MMRGHSGWDGEDCMCAFVFCEGVSLGILSLWLMINMAMLLWSSLAASCDQCIAISYLSKTRLVQVHKYNMLNSIKGSYNKTV